MKRKQNVVAAGLKKIRAKKYEEHMACKRMREYALCMKRVAAAAESPKKIKATAEIARLLNSTEAQQETPISIDYTDAK